MLALSTRPCELPPHQSHNCSRHATASDHHHTAAAGSHTALTHTHDMPYLCAPAVMRCALYVRPVGRFAGQAKQLLGLKRCTCLCLRRASKSATASSSCSWPEQAVTPAATMHVPACKAHGWPRSQLQLLFRLNLSSRQAAEVGASSPAGAPAAAAGFPEPGSGVHGKTYHMAVFLQAGKGIRHSGRHH